MKPGELGRAMRLSITEGALACAMGTLTGGIFLTGFALALGASEFQIGLMAAMPTLANLAQLAGSYLIERGGKRKQLCVRSLAASRFLWLLVFLAPAALLVLPSQAIVWSLVALLAVTSVLNSIGGVGWLTWIKDLVPEEIRIGFLSRRNQVDTVLALSLGIAGGAFIDWWTANHPGSTFGFMGVFALAMLCGLVGLPLLASIPEPPAEPEAAKPPFFSLLKSPLKDCNFRKVLGFYVYWNLAVNMATPFFCVYMLNELKLPFWQVTVLFTLSSVAGLIANPFWTRLSEKFGHRPIVFLATLGDALYPLWWLFVTPKTAWLLLPIHCSGLFGAPLAVGPNNLVLKLSPRRNASPYLAVFSAIVGPMTAIAAVGGGWLAGIFDGMSVSFGAASLGGLQLLFALSLLGRLSSLVLLWRIVEPRSEAVSHVVHVLWRVHVRRPASLLPALGWSGMAASRSPRVAVAFAATNEMPDDAMAAPPAPTLAFLDNRSLLGEPLTPVDALAVLPTAPVTDASLAA